MVCLSICLTEGALLLVTGMILPFFVLLLYLLWALCEWEMLLPGGNQFQQTQQAIPDSTTENSRKKGNLRSSKRRRGNRHKYRKTVKIYKNCTFNKYEKCDKSCSHKKCENSGSSLDNPESDTSRQTTSLRNRTAQRQLNQEPLAYHLNANGANAVAFQQNNYYCSPPPENCPNMTTGTETPPDNFEPPISASVFYSNWPSDSTPNPSSFDFNSHEETMPKVPY